jgi:hypothetical protein
MKLKEVAQNACHRLQCKLHLDLLKKAEFDSDASVLTNFLTGVLNSQTEKLPGDLQDAARVLVRGRFQFREEFLLLQLRCVLLLVGGQDRAYSFRNARNCEDAAQRLQRFVHWEVFFEETFRSRFAVVALNVHGLRHRSKPYLFSPGW